MDESYNLNMKKDQEKTYFFDLQIQIYKYIFRVGDHVTFVYGNIVSCLMAAPMI